MSSPIILCIDLDLTISPLAIISYSLFLEHMVPEEDFRVTPWEVKGKVNYSKLIKQFGTEVITGELLDRIKHYTGGDLHYMLRRGVFFTHRDLKWILDEWDKGNRFYLYTGRGPSESIHIGHLVPWVFTKWLQEKFGVKLLFQLTDDEKYLFKENLDLKKTYNYAIDNALSIVALGFDPKNTQIMIDTDNAKTLYNNALPISKHITFSMVKAAFGFDNSQNLGSIFYTCIQAVPAILESIKAGRNVPCLIPHAIDQDPHFRIARDILPKLGFYKPASIQCKFMPSLGGATGKMSASDPNQSIFVTDSPKVVKTKIYKYAFSGGQGSIAEHRKKGGNPEVDVSYQWLEIMFETDDNKLRKIAEDYRSGALLTGELKDYTIEKINKFLEDHQVRREQAKERLPDFLIKD